jgi:carbonic anhydrase
MSDPPPTAHEEMDPFEKLLRLNAVLPPPGEPLAAQPTLRVSVVTCMDARIDIYRALGLRRGEAHVLRNAGGVVTDDVIRSLAISQRRLGTTAVMVVHHTGCGMLGLDEESLLRVRGSPYLPHRDAVRGYVIDVVTDRLREVPER